MSIPTTLNLGIESLYRVGYQVTLNNDCSSIGNDSTLANSDNINGDGQLTITKLDKNCRYYFWNV